MDSGRLTKNREFIWNMILNSEIYVPKNHIPENVTIASSTNETWWKYSEGHEFQRSVYNRIHRFSECSVCNRIIVVKGVNDFLHQQ
jgi:hypothetical protein